MARIYQCPPYISLTYPLPSTTLSYLSNYADGLSPRDGVTSSSSGAIDVPSIVHAAAAAADDERSSASESVCLFAFFHVLRYFAYRTVFFYIDFSTVFVSNITHPLLSSPFLFLSFPPSQSMHSNRRRMRSPCKAHPRQWLIWSPPLTPDMCISAQCKPVPTFTTRRVSDIWAGW